MALESTVFNDAADPNNSILLVLWVVSIVGLLSERFGAAVAIFTLLYSFAFNAFNLLYFGASIALLNGVSAAINAAAIIYMLIKKVHAF
jgi:hypothetical protein